MANEYDTSAEPLGSTAVKVVYNNASNLDDATNSVTSETWVDRPPFNRVRKTLFGYNQEFYRTLSNIGFESAYITYAAAAVIQRPTQLVVRSGIYYRVTDPTNVPLTLTGTWATDSLLLTDVGDASLRAALATAGSTVVVGGATAGNVGKVATAVTIDADGRMRTAKIVLGTNVMGGSAVRDAVGIYRNLVGLTDCHGFADNTIISGVTDYGGYGSVDVTVTLQGSNNQNHVFSYQSRPTYAGSGNIQHLADFLARPVHSGTGVINERIGVDIGDITLTAGGTVDQQIGVYIRNLTYGTAKVALNVAQTTGFALYAPGGARSYHAGPFRVGVDDVSTVPFSVGVTGSPNLYILPQTGAATIGVSGDSFIRLATNVVTRVEIGNAATQFVFRPGADNSQPLGDATKRWSAVFAGSGTINTSDAREKTEVWALSAAELACGKELGAAIGGFKFLSAIAEKGDSARVHIGMTVQRAIEIMESHGLSPRKYSFICYDKWDKAVVEHPESIVEGETIPAWTEVLHEAGDRYSFRRDDLISFIVASALEDFERRLSALEA